MLKKVFKPILFCSIGLCIILLIIDQNRNIYCLSEGKCVTVWKRIGGTCYIVPYKYYGLFKPGDCYIVTTNSSNIGVIWKGSKEILAQIDDKTSIVSGPNEEIKILNYDDNGKVYDSLFTFKEGYFLNIKKMFNIFQFRF